MFDDTGDIFGNGGGRTWRLIDTRPSVAAHPYTFFVPSIDEIDALERGDLVKLMFENTADGSGSVEHMWVEYEGRDEFGIVGRLENMPKSIEGLHPRDLITFQPWHITAVWELKIDSGQEEEQFFARCHVDPQVLDGTSPILRIERRMPRWYEPRRTAPYANSNWYIYGARRVLALQMRYVAIGVLLNSNPGLLKYIDAPKGTRLVRDGDRFCEPS